MTQNRIVNIKAVFVPFESDITQTETVKNFEIEIFESEKEYQKIMGILWKYADKNKLAVKALLSGTEPAIPPTYTCSLCHKKREIYNKTEIFKDGNWYFGCRGCFIKNIDEYNNDN
jgi:hypothetical protein